MPLTDMFEAIEWHAEARSLSDRATYYIDALCRTSSKRLSPLESLDPLRSDVTLVSGDAIRAMDQSSGFVLAFSRRTATRWKDGKPSLWMLYETFRAQELNLGWDLASTSGALATMRPFDNGCWAFGAFDTDIAQSLSTVAVEADKCTCTRKADRESILNQHLVWVRSILSRTHMLGQLSACRPFLACSEGLQVGSWGSADLSRAAWQTVLA